METSATRVHFARRPESGIAGGVAAGVSASLRVDVNVVRLAFVVLTVAGAFGLVLYGGLWLLLPVDDTPIEPRESDALQSLALGVVVLGWLLLLRTVGWWPGDAFVFPLALAAAGFALVWSRPGASAPTRTSPRFDRLPPAAASALSTLFGSRRINVVRFIGGMLLVLAGIAAFSAQVGSWETLRSVAFGTIVVGLGIALAFGPAIGRLVTELADERRERIRVAERADIAAHLHDSVLQTLALVQRKADEPREVRRLARRQERELRGWLLGTDQAPADGASLGGSLDAVAADVEDTYGVAVEVVRVRDCPAGPALEPLVLASREAMVNAARHSGAPVVSVYLEVEPERATVFVRDRGQGFDPNEVPTDRRGVQESIIGRMTRHGGKAAIRSGNGTEGTEVELVMPRSETA
jgi:signal transduction histidine kinase